MYWMFWASFQPRWLALRCSQSRSSREMRMDVGKLGNA